MRRRSVDLGNHEDSGLRRVALALLALLQPVQGGDDHEIDSRVDARFTPVVSLRGHPAVCKRVIASVSCAQMAPPAGWSG
jgi:hypothetical protein